MNHDAGNIEISIEVLLAQLALVLVQQLTHKIVDLVAIQIRRVLRLLEEESCRVLELFHLIQKNIMTPYSQQSKTYKQKYFFYGLFEVFISGIIEEAITTYIMDSNKDIRVYWI